MMTMLACVACDATSNNVTVSNSQAAYKLVSLTDQLETPWAMVQLPNNDIVVSQRNGHLWRMSPDGTKLTEITGLPKVAVRSQGGLLDLTLHPDFKNNRWLYFTLSSPEGKGEGSNTALMRAKLLAGANELQQVEVLYKGEDNTTKGQHFGSRVVFDNDGYVYFSIGDRGARDIKPQDLSLDGGKIYRLHEDGRIPADNPFVDMAGAKQATFSYGHRNPQGMIKHPYTGDIWAHEHGPRGGDELNLVRAGKNYGWPVITYGTNYSGTSITDITAKEGMEQPVHYWVPSIAPSDMVMVTSEKYPQWQNHLLIGSLKFQYLALVTMNGNSVSGEYKLFENVGRVRSIMQGQDGFIYIGEDSGNIFKVVAKDK